MESQRYDIFISYKRVDKEQVLKLYETFMEAGLKVWMDHHIEPGSPQWEVDIENALENSGCVVVALSPEAKKSPWVRNELHYAGNLGVRIFPVLIDGDMISAVPASLQGVQITDLRASLTYQENLSKVIYAIKRYFGYEAEDFNTSDVPLLTPNSPLSWIRLIYWIIFSPQDYTDYNVIHDSETRRNTLVYIVATLLWLPAIILSLSAQIHIFSSSLDPIPRVIAHISPLIFMGCWYVTVKLRHAFNTYTRPGAGLLLGFIASFFVLAGFWSVTLYDTNSLWVFSSALALASGLAFVMSILDANVIVTNTPTKDILSLFLISILLFLTFEAVFIFLIDENMVSNIVNLFDTMRLYLFTGLGDLSTPLDTADVAFGSSEFQLLKVAHLSGMTFMLTGILLVFMGSAIRKNISTGKSNSLSKLTLVIIILAYILFFYSLTILL